MHCERCGFDNPDGFAFCGKCGSPLAATCPACGFSNPSDFAFCGRCGTALTSTPTAPGLTPADLDHLRRYLPAQLIEALQFDSHAPPPRLLEQCQAHLLQLVNNTAAHLPSYLVQRVRTDPTPGRTGGQFLHGTLLFADISGFTAMAERLSQIGREGAEEITTIVNRYFSVMLGLLREHEGQLIKFGGDALLGLFAEPPADSAARAGAAALRMQAAMSEFAQTRTSQGTFPLQMKIGLRRGRFFAAELGTPQEMEYALFGADVNATAVAESLAAAGQVVADRETIAGMASGSRSAPGPDGYLVLEGFDGPLPSPAEFPPARGPAVPRPGDASLDHLRSLRQLLDALTPYLPAGLLARISRDTGTLQLEGEHRLVCIAFANVVGLGEITDRLGPGREADIVTALNRYFVMMDSALRRFGGVVNKIDLNDRGDKLLAFFGAPVAHEDDAERAVRSAWEMQSALQEVNRALVETGDLPTLQQRLGLSYGYAFAGYMGTEWRREYTVMGDEVNLAARLMAAGEPGTITVSSNVMRKVRGLFDLTAHGTATLKGKREPFRLFTVDGPRAAPEVAQGDGRLRSQVVGRGAAWRQLLGAVDQLFAGRGQIISITGEAGIGKSRLVEELLGHLDAERGPRARRVETRCLSYTEAVSFLSFQEVVRQLLGLRADDSERVAFGKAREVVASRLPHEDVEATLPYLLNFLGVTLEGGLMDRVRLLDAEALQRRTFLAISRLVEASAPSKSQPLLVILDDIQWMDQASLALLDYLLPVVDRRAVLLLLLYRAERDKGCWKIREKAAREFPHCAIEIALERLRAEESAELLTNLIPAEAWSAPLRDMVLRRAEGNPLYIEELVRILVDKQVIVRGADGRWQLTQDVQAPPMPDTLQGVLMSRLDGLDEPPRRTAQVASVVGRSFLFDVLVAVTPGSEVELSPHLSRLQQHEIVLETQRAPDLVFGFKHGLMQQVCYESLLARTRRDYHRRIAEHLEARQETHAGDPESSLALIAQHAYVGQDWPRALKYQLLAGQQAQRLFANADALDHFHKALESAGHLPAEAIPERHLIIHAGLGELLTTTGQYDEGLAHLQQARQLAAELSDGEALARACRWIARLYELRGDYEAAFEWIQQTLEAAGGRDTAEAAQALLTGGLIYTRQGDLDRADAHCREALAIAERLGELAALGRGHSLMGVITRNRGDSAASIRYLHQSVEEYRQAGHIHGQALADNQLANAYFNTGDWQAADQHYRKARESFTDLGDGYNRALVDNNLGGIALNRGRLNDALESYRAALRGLEQIGGSPYVLGIVHMNLGAVFIRRAEVQTAREHLEVSRRHFEAAQARDFLPEWNRHRAAAALAEGDLRAAGTHAEEALSLARELSMRNEAGYALRVLGEVGLAEARTAVAEEQLRQSVSLLDELNEEYEGARSRLVLARALIALGRADAAAEVVAQCEAVFGKLDAALDLQAARELRGRLQAARS